MTKYLVELVDRISDGNLDDVRALIERHPEQLEVFTPFTGGTWLHYAAWKGNLDIVAYLVSAGMRVDIKDKFDGRVPLKDATYKGHAHIVAYLLQRGSPLDVSTSLRNPLFGAIISRSAETAQLLIDAGIDTKVCYNTATMTDMDAVAFAMMQGPHDIARMIALHNADGDEAAAEAAMAEGLRIAHLNTEPVPPGEDVRPS